MGKAIWNSPRYLMLVALAALGFMFAGSVPALAVPAPVTCSSTGASGRDFTVTTDPASTCIGSSVVSGLSLNLNGSNQDGFLDWADLQSLDYVNIANTDASHPLNLDYFLTAPVSPQTGGTFTIDPTKVAGYTNLVLGLKSGDGWAAFFLNALTGTWSISSVNPAGKTVEQALSHATLYGIVAAVPIPAGIGLLGAGIGAIGLLGWRKRSATRAA